MWRIQGLIGRVSTALNRSQGVNSLRITQGHHVEDDLLSPSALLSVGLKPEDSSSGSGKEKHKERKQERTFQYFSAQSPHCSALDAVGLSAAAALFLHLVRRIHFQFSSAKEKTEPSVLFSSKCGYTIFARILTGQKVLPHARKANCLQGLENQASNSDRTHHDEDNHTSTHNNTTTTTTQATVLLDDLSGADSVLSVESVETETCNAVGDQAEQIKGAPAPDEKLSEAISNLQQTTEASIPVILNIIGLKSANAGDYQAAFSCFRMAASQGYSKAQFNVGVCYEKGKGAQKNIEKAALYFKQAAVSGHIQAQYRYAKYILNSKHSVQAEDVQEAISLLKQAAESGLKEAQAYLGVLYAQEPHVDERKAAGYLMLAAQKGDSQSLLNLGQCYEKGFGVKKCNATAIELYQQAAEAGNPHAVRILKDIYQKIKEECTISEDVVLRKNQSSPCFSNVTSFWFDTHSLATPDPHPRTILPRSWSTGQFLLLPVLYSRSSNPPVVFETGKVLGNARWQVTDQRAHSSWTVGGVA
ncbi:death ligand signal enhancer [Polypterus senegalus]|uniref:death ligand signal enhancer n=1 Tax=Polypterus senegalus TaxID=55291 RepID=UPI00196381B4|nr:death ligand signal enhancer [Polypterus senegalus]